MREVKDIYGKTVKVDDERMVLLDYDNAAKTVRYSAPSMDENVPIVPWVQWKEPGIVKDLDERINSKSSPMVYWYFNNAVNFLPDSVDPEGEIWKKTADVVKKNESVFFDKNGNWRGRNVDFYYRSTIEPFLNEKVLGIKED